ncbi:hypothetical protein TrLO_g6551 [Triparma laevis f. longispina]|uniref:SHOCT domain-containing protein n=1 Tax=Triparma laevis f. longispina TaxID=1714387 RepID=A0A9W7FCE7_9STRA|nr:hypothetical protein TrLO_g6551 [Triparma laevis f. longispina]
MDIFSEYDTTQCVLYPVVRYPCCSINFLDGFGIPFLFVGLFFPAMFIVNIPYQIWAKKRFKAEGESVTGSVTSKRAWTTTTQSKNGTRHHQHYAIVVKYPAEGKNINDHMCQHIVTKEFVCNVAIYQNKFEGQEIELIRMKATQGYDPRKACIASDITSAASIGAFLVQGVFVCFFFTFWNFIIFQMPWCIANLYTWPLALFCASVGTYKSYANFKTSGLEGAICNKNHGDQGGPPSMIEADVTIPAANAYVKAYPNAPANIPGLSHSHNDWGFSSSMRSIGKHTMGDKATAYFTPTAHPTNQFEEPLEARIVKLAELRDKGILSEAEFAQAKMKLLTSI